MLVVAVTVNRKGSRRGRRQYIETEWPREFLCRLCLCYCLCTYFNRGRRWYMVTAWPRLFCVCLCLGLSLSVFVFVCVCLCLFFVFVSISIVVIGGEGGILLQRDLVCFVCVCHCLCLCLSLSVFSLCTYFNSCDWGRRWYIVTAWPHEGCQPSTPQTHKPKERQGAATEENTRTKMWWKTSLVHYF